MVMKLIRSLMFLQATVDSWVSVLNLQVMTVVGIVFNPCVDFGILRLLLQEGWGL